MENRYVILEAYSGKADTKTVIAATDNIVDATKICKAMELYRKSQNRDCVFDYEYKKVADDYIDYLDDINFTLMK